ncbi:Transcription factor TFIIIC [Hirschfeldia incana]|nr:Transcription factor TFIIIC [Hirschfeldia incana]
MNDDESVKVTKEEDEYILVDLYEVARHIDIPTEAPYVLSGLDTLNPVLTTDGKIKLVGEYLETIGTCLAFSDKEVVAADNQTLHKTVEPIAKLHKILKFRLALDNVDGANTRSTSL